MAKPIPYTYTGNSLVFMAQGKTTILSKSAPQFDLVIQELKAGNWDKIAELANLRTVITRLSEGRVRVLDDDTVWIGDRQAKGTVVDRIIEMLTLGLGVLPYVRFLDLVDQNPSEDSKTDLYGFIETNSLPLTEDGHFLGYKIVNKNYMDIYTKTIRNQIGDKPSMPRDQVNPDRHQTCSSGLHVCSEEYLPHYGREDDGDRVVVVKVNPIDVVSVPTDYNNAKMRVCKYEVVDELQNWQERLKKYYTPSYSSIQPETTTGNLFTGDDDFDDEEEDDFDEDDDDFLGAEDGAEYPSEKEAGTLDTILTTLESEGNAASVANTYGIPDEKVEQIRKVRKMSKDGWTRTAIADTVGLSRRQVGRILDGQAWSEIV
jgi:hypothetical protein